MKYRFGFVTNSSSSSFVISKNVLTPMQIEAIKYHIYLASKINTDQFGRLDEWHIRESEHFIGGSTNMDNFDMREFLNYIGIPNGAISWGEYNFDLASLEGQIVINEEDSNSGWEELLKEILEEER